MFQIQITKKPENSEQQVSQPAALGYGSIRFRSFEFWSFVLVSNFVLTLRERLRCESDFEFRA